MCLWPSAREAETEGSLGTAGCHWSKISQFQVQGETLSQKNNRSDWGRHQCHPPAFAGMCTCLHVHLYTYTHINMYTYTYTQIKFEYYSMCKSFLLVSCNPTIRIFCNHRADSFTDIQISVKKLRVLTLSEKVWVLDEVKKFMYWGC